VIDFLVFGAVCAVLALALLVILHPTRTVVNVILAAWSALAFCYFVILKRSSAGTIGFRVGRVKVVGIDGRRAGWFGLIVRLFFGALGPLNWLMDLLWLSGDKHRQALRDKFTATYVVKRHAEPAGTGKVVYRSYDICGLNFVFREVEIAQPELQPQPLI
jgi:uncharacterized RDD family membrane protein YckC